MNPKTLKAAFENTVLAAEMAREARTIGMQAREDRRTLVDRLNEQMQLDVAKAAGATVILSAARGDCVHAR